MPEININNLRERTVVLIVIIGACAYIIGKYVDRDANIKSAQPKVAHTQLASESSQFISDSTLPVSTPTLDVTTATAFPPVSSPDQESQCTNGDYTPIWVNNHYVVETGDYWVHADLSPNILGYDEVSILIEPNMKITMKDGIAVKAWCFPLSKSQEQVETEISLHQSRREANSKSITSMSIIDLRDAGYIVSVSTSP